MSFEDLIPRSRGAVEPEGTAVVFAVPRPRRWIWILALAGIVMATLFFFAMGTGYRYGEVSRGQAVLDPSREPEPSDPVGRKKALSKLRAQEKRLAADLQKKEPKGIYVVVDQTQNRIYLKQDEQTLLEARCSAGSGMVLKEAAGGKGRQWVFDTPRGLFKVKNRQADPVWKKPDWAFVEEGKPIPKNEQERFDYGTLGEYAFYLGDGYMIHGTLYERLLGRSVTHGCIRVGKDDLRVLWKYVQVGTPVYIY